MKFIAKFSGSRQCNGISDVLMLTVVGPKMHRSVNSIGLIPNELHDVNFATSGPVDRADVPAEHPKSGPNALTFR